MYLIFDTETTGLPRNFSAPLTDFDNWPRCVQLAWQLHDETGALLSRGDYIVRPDGFTIPYNSEKIHGISTERAMEEGVPLEQVMDRFDEDLKRARFVIGHNLEFDLNIMGAEYLRMGRSNPLSGKVEVDTKDDATEYCKLPGGRGRYKFPKLSELHRILFDVDFEEAHNAQADVEATVRCFFELVRIGVIQLVMPADVDTAGASPAEWIEPENYMGQVRDLKRRLGSDGEDGTESDEHHLEAPTEPTKMRTAAGREAETPFVHLHVHSQFSVLQGTASVGDLVRKAKENGMPAVAMTDLGNMFGIFKFVQAAHKEGIKPIIGTECYFVEDRHQKKFTRERPDRRSQQIFLAKNRKGYENLSLLSSMGYVEGYYYKYPRVDRDLVKQCREGLIALSGGLRGEIADLILNQGEEAAEEAFRWWHETFREDFYVELLRHNLEEEERANEVLLRLATKYDVKVVASNNVFYLNREDAKAHDALLCIDNGELISTPVGRGRGFRYGFPNDQFYFKSQEEMKALFADLPEAIEATWEVAEKVEPIHLERDVILPNFALPDGFDEEDAYLRHLTLQGAEERYGTLSDEIQERIDHELGIIREMGFAGYFLIVQDFIAEARRLEVYVGPGRGSAAGSVVAFCTGITNIDPIRYELLFERFLNPERVSMPDIDIDFDDDGRQKVIDYVVQKYGKDQVAHIITFGTMAARSSVRDVARVLDLPLQEADRLAKLVPETVGISLEEAFGSVKELKEIRDRDTLEGKTLQMAQTLEGSVRNTGIHAAGVIIAPDRLTKYIPISTARDAELFVTQFDGKVIEDAGMLKMDFLGLKTLSILKTAIELVHETTGERLNLDEIPLDDQATFKLYQKGGTIGTFQFESDGMRKYLKQLKPTSIDDLIAMNALYRPGPMQFIPDYIRRKHGEESVEHPHEDLRSILEPTYGIMIYQEQIMMVAQKMGGYSLGEADVLRRIMGKKKPELLPPEEEKFMAQAIEKGYDKATAKDVFDKMALFAGYGFNKSHSAAYSVVAYHTMYFKANHPGPYMAAVLSHNMSDIKKVAFFVEECRELGLEVVPPDINVAEGRFTARDGAIQYGMAAIKGVGSSAIEAIVEEREKGGLFTSIFHFASRIDTRICNRRTIESLIQAGAFDALHSSRSQLLESLDDILSYATRQQEEARLNQANLFGGGASGASALAEPELRTGASWSVIERLNRERELIGFYLSGHPLDRFREDVELFASHKLDRDQLSRVVDRSTIRVVGIVTSIKKLVDRKGRPFAFLTLEDLQGSIECIAFNEVFDRYLGLIQPDTIVMVEGSLDRRDAEPKLILKAMDRVENLREKFQHQLLLQLRLQTGEVGEEELLQVATLLTQYKGETPIRLTIESEHANGPIPMNARKYVIEPSQELMQKLRKLLGRESVELVRVQTGS